MGPMYLNKPTHSGGSDDQRHNCRITGIKYIVRQNRSIYGLVDRDGHTYQGENNDGEVLFDETARTRCMKIVNRKCPACGDWV